MLIYYYRLISR